MHAHINMRISSSSVQNNPAIHRFELLPWTRVEFFVHIRTKESRAYSEIGVRETRVVIANLRAHFHLRRVIEEVDFATKAVLLIRHACKRDVELYAHETIQQTYYFTLPINLTFHFLAARFRASCKGQEREHRIANFTYKHCLLAEFS